jgi:serine/threonine protein kinase
MIGQTLGHYRVLERVGAGGMGVVFRARDEHLERDVALKVLPPGLLADENARKRFKTEALALSRLNHPNVEAVYDFNHQDGVDFLVMEFVEGVTLTQKLSAGPLPEEQVTALGAQIAMALEEAHGKGIIHRDLKPGNIMVTPKGIVKVLDFGLATLLHHPIETATTQPLGVGETAAAGTLPYIAPEQLRGTRADPRSDIYAAGAVLYEMATARRLFAETESLLLVTAILNQVPVEPEQINRGISDDLSRIIAKALDKNPERRYQSASELRVDLERAAEPLLAPTGRPRAFWWVAAGTSLLMVAGATGFLVRSFARRDDLGNPNLIRLVTTPGEETHTRISPTGEWVSVSSNRTGKGLIWLHQPAGGEPKLVHQLQGNIESHAWSSRGDEIAALLVNDEGVFLQIVPALGGPPRASARLDATFGDGRVVRWVGSDLFIFVPSTGLWQLQDGSSEPRLLIPARTEKGRRVSFDVCADGKTVLAAMLEESRRSLWTSPLSGAPARRISPSGFSAGSARFMDAACRRVVFISGRGGEADLWQMPLDGAPSRVTFSGGVKRLEDASPDGSLITFEEIHHRANLWLMDPRSRPPGIWELTAQSLLDYWPTAAGGTGLVAFQRSIPTEGGSPEIFSGRIFLGQIQGTGLQNLEAVVQEGGRARLSPDGKYLAYIRSHEGKSQEVWLKEFATGHSWRVTGDFLDPRMYATPYDALEENLVWSRSGDQLYLVSIAERERQIIRVDAASSTTPPEVLVSGHGGEFFSDLQLSADGSQLSFVSSDAVTPKRSELRTLDLESAKSRMLMHLDHGIEEDLISRGWIGEGKALLALHAAINPDWSERVEVLRVDTQGSVTRLGGIDRAFGGTARLDPTGERLILIGSDPESGADNLYEFRLSDGRLTPLTANRSLRASFSGIEFLADGRVIYSGQERDSEFRVIRYPR